jgi:DNA-binding CsgD family transcriptional regulator
VGPLVGRERELDTVDRFIGQAASETTCLVIEGPAGIGKSVLWAEGVERARSREASVLQAHPSAAEQNLAFATISDLLAAARDDLYEALPAPQRRALARALLLDDDGGRVDPRAAAAGFLSVIRALADEASTLVIAVDDLQWVDPASSRMLAFAASRLTSECVGFLVTRRKSEPPTLSPLGQAFGSRIEKLHIEPLSLGATHQLLRSRLGVAFSRPLLRRLHEASGGNPLFVLELGRTLRERGGEVDPGRPLPVPSTVEELVRSRVDELSRPVQVALATAAAMGYPTLASVGDLSAVDVAADSGVIQVQGEQIRFTHPLLASAAYGVVDAETRRAIHRRLADIVQEPVERARHLALSADAPNASIAGKVERAAALAASRGAPDLAAELAELATRLTPPHDREARGARRLLTIDHWLQAGETDLPRRALEEMVGELPPGPDRAAVLLRIMLVSESDPNTNLEVSERALAEAAGRPELLAALHNERASAALSLGRLEAARREAHEALGLAPAGSTGALRAFADVGLLEALAGEHPFDEAAWRHAVELERELDGTLQYGPLVTNGLRLMWADRLDEGRAALEEAYARARSHGNDPHAVTCEFHLSELECRAGRFHRASAWASQVDQSAGRTGMDQSSAGALYVTALAASYLGDAEQARAAAEEGIMLAERASDVIFRIQSQTALGFLELSLGDAGEAARHLRPLWDELEAMGYGDPSVYPVLPNAIEALVNTGETDEARRLLERLEELGRLLDSPWALALAARCRGLLDAAEGNLDGARADLERALVEHERLPSPFERARTLLALGVVQRRLKRRTVARETLTDARERFADLGARLWEENARAELARVSGRRRSPELTETERRVAELAAEGLRTKQIAAALYVSVNTVETHLRSVYAKLRVHSRAELARHLAEPTGIPKVH